MNYRNDSRGRQMSTGFEFLPTQQTSCSPNPNNLQQPLSRGPAIGQSA